MGILIGMGKVLEKIALKVLMIGGVMYIEYRVSGGPPIRKVYKAAKDRKTLEQVEQAKKTGNIVQLEDYRVV